MALRFERSDCRVLFAAMMAELFGANNVKPL